VPSINTIPCFHRPFSKFQPDCLVAMRCRPHARHVELDTRRGRSRSSWRHDQRINSAEPLSCCVDERDGWKKSTTAALSLAPPPFAVERRCDGEVGIFAPMGPRPHRYTQHPCWPIQTALVATVAAASAVVDGWGIASAAPPPFSAPLSAMCLMGTASHRHVKSLRPLRFFGSGVEQQNVGDAQQQNRHLVSDLYCVILSRPDCQPSRRPTDIVSK
jgi:hypothetical protein